MRLRGRRQLRLRLRVGQRRYIRGLRQLQAGLWELRLGRWELRLGRRDQRRNDKLQNLQISFSQSGRAVFAARPKFYFQKPEPFGTIYV